MATHHIKDISLADEGQRRIEWALNEMPVVRGLAQRFAREQPLAGVRVSACLHVTAETANLLRALKGGGASIALAASNPLSTQDDVAAALVVHDGIPTHAIRGESTDVYYEHLVAAVAHGPQLTLDDGADLISLLHARRTELLPNMIGGMEETTTGVMRLRAMAREGALKYPVIAVNDAMTKHLFDNRYGTGQSTLDGVIRATNILIAGKVFTVVGYGWCGRGIALRARGMGANVIVTEVDPLRALEAVMDGFRVLPLVEAASLSDFIITASGNKHVIDTPHLAAAKDGCVLANAGHFDIEVNIHVLESMTVSKHVPRANVKEYRLTDGRVLRLLAEGRLVNLAAAEGHPSAVMDMSFANQLLCAEYFVRHRGKLNNGVHEVPREIDARVAQLKLAAMGIQIDHLTDVQVTYLASWREGT